MSLSEVLQGQAQSLKPIVNVPAPEYTSAVKQVVNAPSGATISRKGYVQAIPAAPTIVTDPIEVLGDLGNLLLSGGIIPGGGSREAKIDLAADFVPAAYETIPDYDISMETDPSKIPMHIPEESFKDRVKEIITFQKDTLPGAAEYWGQNVLGGTDVTLPTIPESKLPDLTGWISGLGKYALIGGGLILAAIFFSKK